MVPRASRSTAQTGTTRSKPSRGRLADHHGGLSERRVRRARGPECCELNPCFRTIPPETTVSKATPARDWKPGQEFGHWAWLDRSSGGQVALRWMTSHAVSASLAIPLTMSSVLQSVSRLRRTDTSSCLPPCLLRTFPSSWTISSFWASHSYEVVSSIGTVAFAVCIPTSATRTGRTSIPSIQLIRPVDGFLHGPTEHFNVPQSYQVYASTSSTATAP